MVQKIPLGNDFEDIPEVHFFLFLSKVQSLDLSVQSVYDEYF